MTTQSDSSLSPVPTHFTDKLIDAMRRKRSVLCAGIDLDIRDLPPHLVGQFLTDKEPDDWDAIGRLLAYCATEIIGAVAPFAVAVKPNEAFVRRYGHCGGLVTEAMIRAAREHGLLYVGDAKVSDGGKSAEANADAHIGEVPVWNATRQAFETRPGPFRGDAVTLETTIAGPGIEEYVKVMRAHGTGGFVVVRTSFGKTPSEIEEAPVFTDVDAFIRAPRLWHLFARMIHRWGEGTQGEAGWQALGAVVGATRGSEDAIVARRLMPHCIFLKPGFGAQGGTADDAVSGVDEEGFGVLVNSSREISNAWKKGPFAGPPEKFAERSALAGERARDDLNAALKRAGNGRGVFWDD